MNQRTKQIQKLITAVKSDNFCYYKDRRARSSRKA